MNELDKGKCRKQCEKKSIRKWEMIKEEDVKERRKKYSNIIKSVLEVAREVCGIRQKKMG